MSAYKRGRRDWVPITVLITSLVLAAIAVAMFSLYMQGVTFK